MAYSVLEKSRIIIATNFYPIYVSHVELYVSK